MDDSPAWSPDGKWIAYTHINPDPGDTLYPTGLYVVDTEGQNRRLLIDGAAYSPDWSPDGKKIAFNSGDIFSIDLRGDNIKRITNFGEAYFPSWSPDGKKIAFDSPYRDTNGSKGASFIWIINADGTNPKNISEHGVGDGRDPSWGPDGSRLVYLGFPKGVFGEEIFVMDTTGTNSVRLTKNERTDRAPDWSPDGTLIAWWTVIESGTASLWLMKPDGSAQRKLTTGLSPSWSPDSRAIAFSNFTPKRDKIVLWIIKVDGSGLKQITN